MEGFLSAVRKRQEKKREGVGLEVLGITLDIRAYSQALHNGTYLGLGQWRKMLALLRRARLCEGPPRLTAGTMDDG